jgi:peptidoglycan hydrolase-like protein with peptidoglycan-binding domain
MGDVPSSAEEDTASERRHWKRVARRYQRYLARGHWTSTNWVRYGYALKECGELDSATQAYAVGLSLEADSFSDAHREAGHLHEARGDTQRAVQSYKSALKLNPENRDAADDLRVLGVLEEEVASIIEGAKDDRHKIGLRPADLVLVAKSKSGPPIRRNKWGPVFAAVIIAICLVGGGASLLVGPPPGIAEVASRSDPAGAPPQKALTEVVVRQEAALKLPAADARPKVKEETRPAAEEKPKSDAERREQAERAEAALALSEQDRKGVQVALNALGHDFPTVTGYFGPRTRATITAWQKKQGLPETGYLDASQFALLQEQATPAKRTDDAKLDPRQQPEKAEAALNLSEQDRKRVQVALNALGHEMPTVTGYFGPRTRAMITAWQKAQGLPETGCLTEAQLAMLREQAAPALAKYDQAQAQR